MLIFQPNCMDPISEIMSKSVGEITDVEYNRGIVVKFVSIANP